MDGGSIDGRFDPRYPVECEIWLTDLQHTGSSACGTIRDISTSGVCVVTPLAFTPADSVRMDVADSVFYGFVTYSRPEKAGTETVWRTGIEVQRVMVGDSDLGTLLRKLLAEEMPHVTTDHPAHLKLRAD